MRTLASEPRGQSYCISCVIFESFPMFVFYKGFMFDSLTKVSCLFLRVSGKSSLKREGA